LPGASGERDPVGGVDDGVCGKHVSRLVQFRPLTQPMCRCAKRTLPGDHRDSVGFLNCSITGAS
jgi:hypothetical protein